MCWMISVEGKALAQGEAIFQSITPIVVSKAVLQIHFAACYFWKQVIFQGKIGKCGAIKKSCYVRCVRSVALQSR